MHQLIVKLNCRPSVQNTGRLPRKKYTLCTEIEETIIFKFKSYFVESALYAVTRSCGVPPKSA